MVCLFLSNSKTKNLFLSASLNKDVYEIETPDERALMTYLNKNKSILSDEIKCINFLLTKEFDYDGKRHTVFDLIHYIKSSNLNPAIWNQVLNSLGISYIKEQDILEANTSNPKIINIMKNYDADNWIEIILRVKNISCKQVTNNNKEQIVLTIKELSRFL